MNKMKPEPKSVHFKGTYFISSSPGFPHRSYVAKVPQIFVVQFFSSVVHSTLFKQQFQKSDRLLCPVSVDLV